MTNRSSQFARHVNIDTTPMPDNIPKVPEIGATSAPLFSAAYFIGARCRPYSDDYMEFRDHWQCLENQNHQLWNCRRAERRLNQCVFDKIGLAKVIPGAPKGAVPVHLRQEQIFATWPQDEISERPWRKFTALQSEKLRERWKGVAWSLPKSEKTE